MKAPVDWLADIVHSRFARRRTCADNPKREQTLTQTRKKAWMGDSISLSDSEIEHYYANTESVLRRKNWHAHDWLDGYFGAGIDDVRAICFSCDPGNQLLQRELGDRRAKRFHGGQDGCHLHHYLRRDVQIGRRWVQFIVKLFK